MNLEDKLSSVDFDVNAYIKEVAFQYDSSEDLLQHKKRIQMVAERTAQKLKQNVYQNYALFIDTSREISALEAEMYQLSHMLNEHQGLTSTIQTVTQSEASHNIAVPAEPDTQEKYTIASLLETVEGSSTVTEVPSRYIVYMSNLYEVDDKMEAVEQVRAFLLNDSLLLATLINTKRKGPVKYQFRTLYELDNLAVLNIKDTDKMKHMFQIRMFPESHMFQADTESVKTQWIQHLETTKQKLVTERENFKNINLSPAMQKLGSRRPRNASDGPIRTLTRQMTEVSMPAWVKDAPENLDVFIAQREFEQAVDLIDKMKRHIKDCPDQISLKDIRARVNYRINHLGEVLMKELQSSPSGSLRGGPRAARKAISLLLRLGRATKACELFLANHSRINEHELKQIKLEGATTIYITNVSSTFFNSLSNAAREFSEAFKNNTSSFSSFVTWAIREIDSFLRNYCVESIFPPVKSNLNFTMVTECVSIIRAQCKTLLKSGLDLDFKIMNFLHVDLSNALCDARELLEAKLTTIGGADTWDPMDCRQNQAQVAQIVLHLDNIGVPSPSNLVNDNIVDLSKTVFTSCQSILNYVDSYFKIHTPELLGVFTQCLCDLFRHSVSIIAKAMGEDTLLPKTDFLTKNSDLLILSALPALTLKIQKSISREIPEMVALQEELKQHMELIKSGIPDVEEISDLEDNSDEDRV
jgi:hypothetical protein